jgi:hypothetical protein
MPDWLLGRAQGLGAVRISSHRFRLKRCGALATRTQRLPRIEIRELLVRGVYSKAHFRVARLGIMMTHGRAGTNRIGDRRSRRRQGARTMHCPN